MAKSKKEWAAFWEANNKCKTCGRKLDTRYKHCSACLESHRQAGIKRKKTGQCDRCSDQALPGKVRCQKCQTKTNTRSRLSKANLKEDVISHYGGKCACCGIVYLPALCIDHIEGNGNKHRKQLGGNNSFNIYGWLKKQGHPPGYQVLCWNCNAVKSFNGTCTIPH